MDAQQKLLREEQYMEEVLTKRYLQEMELLPISQENKDIQPLNILEDVRVVHVQKIAVEPKRELLHKMMTIYNTIHHLNKKIIYLIQSRDGVAHLYIGLIKNHSSATPIHFSEQALIKSMTSNFPGSSIESLSNKEISHLLDEALDITSENEHKSIAAVTGIPALKESFKEDFIQGMENFIDALEGEDYTALFIAEPMQEEEVETIRKGYELLYTTLAPYRQIQHQDSSNRSLTLSESETENISQAISKGTTATQGVTKSRSFSLGLSMSKEKPTSQSKISGGLFGAVGFGRSKTQSQAQTNTTSDTKGHSSSETKGKTLGEAKSVTLTYENKTVTNQLALIDRLLERIEVASDYGLWKTGFYFIAEDQPTAAVAASHYRALIRGEDSSLEDSSTNIWSRGEDKETFDAIAYALRQLEHPTFEIDRKRPSVTPTSLLSGKELAIGLGFPQHSVVGIPVSVKVPFAREVVRVDQIDNEEGLKLGHVFHMGQVKEEVLQLERQSLAMHTLIVGSTGSGKSNTMYTILEEAIQKGLKFMVIEPAKGEYKHIFGHRPYVQVYGTNAQYSELLRVNPFTFPENIHVLEHIDRFIEILNVCWPMYAAMPAMMKEAMLEAYESCGWDLTTSMNERPLYPNFHDLLEALERVVDQSSFSEEVKSNYRGSLVTRVRSLTNGLNNQLFSGEELSEEQLFDRNVIIDLSRIGSAEMKSLLMGILVMKLNEYRMSASDGMNIPLQHLTVLEEAHHLLKRTSTEQSDESSNMAGKSVEMLAHSIAEMRTYGEGFMIVDQSPNALDMAAIRNTNTKIIMRLPEESDRQLVGKSIALDDEQLEALARLPKGVAAVYQNDWLEPVLSQINYFDEEPTLYKKPDIMDYDEMKKQRNELFYAFAKGIKWEVPSYDYGKARKAIYTHLSSARKQQVALDYLNGKQTSENQLRGLIAELLSIKTFLKKIPRKTSIADSQKQLYEYIKRETGVSSYEEVKDFLSLF